MRYMIATVMLSLVACPFSLRAQTVDWPKPFYDASNSSSPSVAMPDGMAVRWSRPAGDEANLCNPLTCLTSSGEQLLISGKYIYDAAIFGDFNAVEAAAMLTVTIAIATRLIGDLAYTFLNPRIRYG